MHAVDPIPAAYVDGGQGSQAVAPAPDTEPAGHGVWRDAPSAPTYDPASTSAHETVPAVAA